MILERDPVVVGTELSGLTFSRFTCLDDGTPYTVDVALQVDGLTARISLYSDISDSFDDVVAFFAALERDWRGWSGVKRFESLEHDLAIDAVHDGHIWLQVSLRPGAAGWSATARVRLDPGEQLAQAVRDLRSFLERP